MKEQVYTYTVHIEPAQEGGYTVSVPLLPGCYTQADTWDEALANAREAITLYLEGLVSDGEDIPVENNSATVALQVRVPATL